jgi:hypothetical protein
VFLRLPQQFLLNNTLWKNPVTQGFGIRSAGWGRATLLTPNKTLAGEYDETLVEKTVS